MNLTEFESKWDVTISDVKILGKSVWDTRLPVERYLEGNCTL